MLKEVSKLRRPLLVGLIIAACAAIGLWLGILQSWSSLARDRLFLPRPADPSIVIVAIDDASLAQIGRWPWDRHIHAELINKLSQAGVAAIGYDVNFPEPSTPQDDAALAEALRRSGKVVLPIELSLFKQHHGFEFSMKSVVQSLPIFSAAAAQTGHTNAPPDGDGVVRSIPLFVFGSEYPGGFDVDNSVPAFAYRVFRLTHPTTTGAIFVMDRDARVWINFNGQPKHIFKTISAIDVLRGSVDTAFLKGATVFVGATASDLHDEQLVPTSNGVLMPGVELHASLYETIRSEHWLRMSPIVWQALFLLLLGASIALCIALLRVRYSLLTIALLWGGYIIGAFVLFDRGWMVDLVWPTLVIIFVSAAVLLERRITIDHERRQLRSAFSRYVSGSVVQSILHDPSKLKLGGEKRRMSVLFSDVRGFTTIAEGMAPEHLVDVMNIYLTRMTDIVFANEGVLDKYIGDAVMAFWNAPFDQPDHALRAIKTALTMQTALSEMNAAQAFGEGMIFKIGVGVNSGDMIVGNMGSETRFDYTVIGDNVNLASRLEGITKEYGVGIIISEATYRDVAQTVLARRIDKVAVKGKKEPVIIYEAVALIERATPAQKRLVEMFEAALAAYFAKDFSTAIAACEAIQAAFPDDGPTKIILERVKYFMVEPPPVDWNGVYVFTKK